MIELLVGLFGGFGAILLWEGFLKRFSDRRQTARVLAAEIRWHLQHCHEIIEIRRRDPGMVPQERQSSHSGFSAVGSTIGALPADVLIDVLAFYRTSETIATLTKDFNQASAPDRGLLEDFDRILSVQSADGSTLLARLERLGGGKRLGFRLDADERKRIEALAESHVVNVQRRIESRRASESDRLSEGKLPTGKSRLEAMGALETSTDSERQSRAFDMHVAEYGSLREEIFARLESQRQAFSYLVTILAAAVGLTAADNIRMDPVILMLLLPIVVAPLGFIFFDNELMIFRNGAYLSTSLRPRVETLVGKMALLDDIGLSCLGGFSCRIHELLSYGRWLLFLLPTVGPIPYVVVSRPLLWMHYPWLPVLILDGALAMLLGLAMIAAALEQRRWRRHQGGIH
jgi:hypothetical protein